MSRLTDPFDNIMGMYRNSSCTAPMTTAHIVPLWLGGAAHLAGQTFFFAGVAAGLLLVFVDRHDYERPITARFTAGLVVAGLILSGVGWLGQQFGM